MKIIILTAGQTRHQFLINYLASQKNIEIVACFVEKKLHQNQFLRNKLSPLQIYHFKNRDIKEKLFFGSLINKNKKYNFKINYIKPYSINSKKIYNFIKKNNSDYVISFGCTIIGSRILNLENRNFVNIHLGLSPYYLGSGTNFWPFVYNSLQFLGVTFLETNNKIDSGRIIHQIRPKFLKKDDIHDIGNKLILSAIQELLFVLKNFNKFKKKNKIKNVKSKIFKRVHFNDYAIKKAYKNIENNIISKYLKNKKRLEKKFKIINLRKL